MSDDELRAERDFLFREQARLADEINDRRRRLNKIRKQIHALNHKRAEAFVKVKGTK